MARGACSCRSKWRVVGAPTEAARSSTLYICWGCQFRAPLDHHPRMAGHKEQGVVLHRSEGARRQTRRRRFRREASAVFNTLSRRAPTSIATMLACADRPMHPRLRPQVSNTQIIETQPSTQQAKDEGRHPLPQARSSKSITPTDRPAYLEPSRKHPDANDTDAAGSLHCVQKPRNVHQCTNTRTLPARLRQDIIVP